MTGIFSRCYCLVVATASENFMTSALTKYLNGTWRGDFELFELSVTCLLSIRKLVHQLFCSLGCSGVVKSPFHKIAFSISRACLWEGFSVCLFFEFLPRLGKNRFKKFTFSYPNLSKLAGKSLGWSIGHKKSLFKKPSVWWSQFPHRPQGKQLQTHGKLRVSTEDR